MSDFPRVTPEQLAWTCADEGAGYALLSYYSRQVLEEITDDEVRFAALDAHDALVRLNAVLPEVDY